MRTVLDVAYSDAASDVRRLDLFLPDEPNGAALLFIHGGGWKKGDRTTLAPWAKLLAERGYVGAACSYHLAPNHRFPLPYEDVRLAMAYLRTHAPQWGCDPDRVGVVGSSAGGQLAGLLCCEADLGDVDYDLPTVDADTRPDAAVLFGPAAGFRPMEEFAGFEKPRSYYLPEGRGDDPAWIDAASPVEQVSGREPPTLIIVGALDTTTPPVLQRLYYERLHAAGVTVELVEIPTAQHGFEGPYQSERVLERITDSLSRHL